MPKSHTTSSTSKLEPTGRFLNPYIQDDLSHRKMVFIGGPRQVGKTTLALSYLDKQETHPAYLNWDVPTTRQQLLKGELPSSQPLLIFDEIHKYARWRSLLKGFYDTMKSHTKFLVTGSARLDYYRKGGDSLVGRYHYYRLHPYSLRELSAECQHNDLKHLLKFGGFPEPLIRGDEVFLRRWSRERLHRVVQEDLTNLHQVKELSLIELLLSALPERVGSPLSVKNLRELLEVSHESVERWISILENLYIVFRISPYGAPKIRAVKKEQKLYFWDWSQITDEGARFENLVASQLLKYCHFVEDTTGHAMELRFVRDTDKREIDFVVLKDKKPIFAVESKTGEKQPSAAAHYFRARTPIRTFYQVHLGERDYGDAATGVRVLPFRSFCKELQMP